MSIASFDVPENHMHDYSTLSEENKSDADVLLPLLLTINGVKRSRFVIRPVPNQNSLFGVSGLMGNQQ